MRALRHYIYIVSLSHEMEEQSPLLHHFRCDRRRDGRGSGSGAHNSWQLTRIDHNRRRLVMEHYLHWARVSE
jgi:hypothetical protein